MADRLSSISHHIYLNSCALWPTYTPCANSTLSLSLSLRMSARSHRKISEYYGGSLSLSLHNSATNDEEKKVCQITWTFKLQNIVWYLSYGKLNTHLHFSWSNNGSFEMINFLYGTTCLLVKILCMRKKNSFFLYNPLEKIRG